MKQAKKTLNLLLLAAALCAIAACEQGDETTRPGQPDGNDGAPGLCIIATKQPFADKAGTRADTDLGGTYATTFATGDEIGVIAVKSGSVMTSCNNLKQTYNATSGTWTGDAVPYDKSATYIAYYPYRSAMNGKTTTQQIFNAFPLPTVQNTAATFASADLMTSTACTVNKAAGTLTINFEHRMAMLEVVPVLYAKTSSYDMTYAIVNCGFTAAALNGTTSISFFKNPADKESDAPYRCLLKPGTYSQLTLSYAIFNADRTGSMTNTLDAGSQTFVAGHRRKITASKTRDIMVGDYYYRDGSIFPVEAAIDNGLTVPKDWGDTYCFGIVYCNDPGRILQDPEIEPALMASGIELHGLMMTINPPSAQGRWGLETTDETFINNCNSAKLMWDDMNGLSHTKAVFNTYGERTNPLIEYYQCFYSIVLDNSSARTLPHTTERFLPSIGQWWEIMRNLGGVEELDEYMESEESTVKIAGAAQRTIDALNARWGRVSGAHTFTTRTPDTTHPYPYPDEFFISSSEYDTQNCCGVFFDFKNDDLYLREHTKVPRPTLIFHSYAF